MDEIRHPLIREAIRLVGLDPPYREITSMADIPGGTGLGSSGSFTTALLKALHLLKKNLVSPGELAEQACHIEIDVLKEPVGKQDQYIAAFGGIHCFTFLNNGQVEASPLAITNETLYNLEDNLMLFFTGVTRMRVEHPQRPGRQEQAERQRDDRQSALRQGHCPANPQGLGSRATWNSSPR